MLCSSGSDGVLVHSQWYCLQGQDGASLGHLLSLGGQELWDLVNSLPLGGEPQEAGLC